MKFDELYLKINENESLKINENESYVLNNEGRALLQKFYSIKNSIEESIIPVIEPLVKDVAGLKNEIAVQIISTINSQQLGSEEFEIMSRLDTMTSGGKTPIPQEYTFNPSDPVLNYLEKQEMR